MCIRDSGSISWDPTILSYTNTGATNLPGFLPNANLNEIQTNNGLLGFSWLDLSGSSPVSIPDGGLLIELCFDVIGNQNDVAVLSMTDMPTIISVSQQPPNPSDPSIDLDFSLENGSFTVVTGPPGGGGSGMDTVNFVFPMLTGNNGDNVCLPITVENFTDINSANGSFMWNPTVLSYTGVGNTSFPGFLPQANLCLLYTSPSPRDRTRSRMPSSA